MPTEILYGDRDHIITYESIAGLSRKHHARLTVMENGEHWFSDIIGAALLSSGLVMMYKTITEENYE